MAQLKSNKFGEVSEGTRSRYLQSLASQVALLRLAMERSDNESVREICHRIRGSAGLFGLKALGDVCRDVEEACVQKNSAAIVTGFQMIELLARGSVRAADAS